MWKRSLCEALTCLDWIVVLLSWYGVWLSCSGPRQNPLIYRCQFNYSRQLPIHDSNILFFYPSTFKKCSASKPMNRRVYCYYSAIHVLVALILNFMRPVSVCLYCEVVESLKSMMEFHENVNNGFNGKTSKVGAKMNANLDKKHAVCDK